MRRLAGSSVRFASLVACAMCAAVCAKSAPPVVAERRAAIRELISQAQKLAPQQEAAWHQAMQRRAAPSKNGAACPVAPTLPIGGRAMSEQRRATVVGALRVAGTVALVGAQVVKRDDLAGARSPRHEKLVFDVQRVLERLKNDDELIGEKGAALLAEAQEMATAAYWTPDLTVVADVFLPPRRASKETFEGGALRGTSYVYDYGKRAIVCVGEVSAESSKDVMMMGISVGGGPSSDLDMGNLENDLRVNAVLDAMQRWVAAEP